MAAKLYWTPLARENLFEIYSLIGADNPAAAESILGAIEAQVEMLASYPRMGARHPEIRRSARILVEYPYLVLYETKPDADRGVIDTVNIMRIVDGRRDLTRLV